jgi:hypothetical protein
MNLWSVILLAAAATVYLAALTVYGLAVLVARLAWKRRVTIRFLDLGLFIALVLLAASGVFQALGDDPNAADFSIMGFCLLVLSVLGMLGLSFRK